MFLFNFRIFEYIPFKSKWLNLVTKKQQQDILDKNNCVFCMFNNFSKRNPSIKYYKSSMLELLFNICRDRKDDIAHELLAKEVEIKTGKIKLN